MNESEIYLPLWQDLTDERRLDIFRQILRYFVRPLWPVTNIRLLKMQYGQMTINTCQADLNYQTFIFVPGNLSANFAGEEKAISPFMIARAATPSNLLFMGHLNVVTGEVVGDQRRLKSFTNEIDAYVYRRRHSLDPFTDMTETAQVDQIIFQETEAESISLYLQKHWQYADLRQELRAVGCNFATKNQWEYSAVGNLNPFELPINQDWTTTRYYQTGFGVGFEPAKNYELLNDRGIVKANPFQLETNSAATVETIVYADVDAAFPEFLTSAYLYRPVISVQLD